MPIPFLFGGTAGLGRVLNEAPVYIPNRFSAIPTRGNITGAFTRAGVKNVPDFEGWQYRALSGERCFWHVRRVENKFTFTEDLTNAAWTKGSTSATATVITASSGGSARTVNRNFTSVAGNTYTFSVDVAEGTTDWCFLQITDGVNDANGKYFDAANGVAGGTTGLTAGTNVTLVSSGIAASTTTAGAYRVQITVTIADAATYTFACGLCDANDSTAVTANKTLTATKFQHQDVTGQSVQTASEYVSVGVAAAPYYHGSFVDGVECFGTDYNNNPLPTSESATYPMRGAWDETAATQLIATTADIRDMTTASWTLGATMTRARTSVGADGAANSATRLTGGAVAATNTCYYTLVAAASSRTYSALVRRVTGTGPVRIVQTGTETDISAQLNTTGYALVQLNASILNAVMGFKIDTNGDAIDVDMNQFEAGTAGSSRILTGGATRPADVMTYTGADVAPIKAMAATFVRLPGVATAGVAAEISDGTTSNRNVLYLSSATAATFTGISGGATQWNQNASNAYTPATQSKISISAATNSILMDFAGTAQTPDTTATLPAAVSKLTLGCDYGGGSQLNGATADLYFWHRNPSQSELAAVDS